jgi:hypothetical protein
MWVIFQHPSGNFSPDERQAVPGIELGAGSLQLSYILIRSINRYNVIKLKADYKIRTNNLCHWVQNFRVPVNCFIFCNGTHALNTLHIPHSNILSYPLVSWNAVYQFPSFLCICTHAGLCLLCHKFVLRSIFLNCMRMVVWRKTDRPVLASAGNCKQTLALHCAGSQVSFWLASTYH